MNIPYKTPTALPIYLQISEVLIREIAAGRLKNGERLPAEKHLAEQYKTTVRTLRKALSELSKHGLLERVQGSGNYIKTDSANEGRLRNIYSMFRLELKNGGGLPSARVLSVERCEKPSDFPDFGSSNQASRIRRLRYLNQTPVAIEEIWLDHDCGVIHADKLSDSLYFYYRNSLGFWISSAQDRVSICEVPPWSPTDFLPNAGEISGYIERLSWAQRPEAIEFSKTWFDASKAQYIQRFS